MIISRGSDLAKNCDKIFRAFDVFFSGADLTHEVLRIFFHVHDVSGLKEEILAGLLDDLVHIDLDRGFIAVGGSPDDLNVTRQSGGGETANLGDELDKAQVRSVNVVAGFDHLAQHGDGFIRAFFEFNLYLRIHKVLGSEPFGQKSLQLVQRQSLSVDLAQKREIDLAAEVDREAAGKIRLLIDLDADLVARIDGGSFIFCGNDGWTFIGDSGRNIFR